MLFEKEPYGDENWRNIIAMSKDNRPSFSEISVPVSNKRQLLIQLAYILLDKDPSRRPQTCDEILDILNEKEIDSKKYGVLFDLEKFKAEADIRSAW